MASLLHSHTDTIKMDREQLVYKVGGVGGGGGGGGGGGEGVGRIKQALVGVVNVGIADGR